MMSDRTKPIDMGRKLHDFLKKPLLPFFLLVLLLGLAHGASPKPLEPTSSTRHHFILVHGSCHGGWSWYKLVRLLRSSGHEVTALDLAASGVDPRQASSLKSISDYFEPLTELMMSLNSSQRVVLVGHSLGGLAISQAMERFPRKICVAVFVTAPTPGPSLNVSILNNESLRRSGPVLDSRYTYDNGPNNPPTTFIFGPIHLAKRVYQLSPIEDWTLATSLMRPLHLFSDEDMSREIVLSEERYGTVSKVFIQSEGDRLTPNDLVEWMLERNPPNEVLKIKGSDHMVMMSRPLELCSHLLYIARKYS